MATEHRARTKLAKFDDRISELASNIDEVRRHRNPKLRGGEWKQFERSVHRLNLLSRRLKNLQEARVAKRSKRRARPRFRKTHNRLRREQATQKIWVAAIDTAVTVAEVLHQQDGRVYFPIERSRQPRRTCPKAESDIEVKPVFDERNFNGVGHFRYGSLPNPGWFCPRNIDQTGLHEHGRVQRRREGQSRPAAFVSSSAPSGGPGISWSDFGAALPR